MISSLNLYTQLYLAAQVPPAGPDKDKAPEIKSCRREAEPNGAQADRLIGKEVTESHYQLSRIKVEDSFSQEQLETVVKAIAQAPLAAVYSNERSGHEDLFLRQPAQKAILERDLTAHKADCPKPQQGEHRHLYFYFRNPEYWDNAIILLSVFAQKEIESDDRAGILRATKYCRDYKARIARQKFTRQFEPVEYYEAILDLTEAELMAQVKGKLLAAALRKGDTSLNNGLVTELRAYYTRARDQVQKAITTLLSFKDRFFWPSEPDYFSIPKALILLGDLNIKLKEVNRLEIGLLRRANRRGVGPQEKLKLQNRITELEKQNLELIDGAYVLYGALQKIDEHKGTLPIKIDLPELKLKMEFTPDDIKTALATNTAKGFLEETDRLEALKGIFHLLRAVAALKQASLLPQLPSSFVKAAAAERLANKQRPLTAIKEVVRGPEIIAALKNCNQALGDLTYMLSQLRLKLKQSSPAMRRVLQERISKLENGFYFPYGRLVKADVTLALLDRLNFSLIGQKERPAWENFLAVIEALEPLNIFETPPPNTGRGRPIPNSGELKEKIRAELKYPTLRTDGKGSLLLDYLRYDFTRLMAYSTEIKYQGIKNDIVATKKPAPFHLKHLTAWAEVKLIELAVRDASYVSDAKIGKDTKAANDYIARAEELKKRWVERSLVKPDQRQLFDLNDQEHPGFVFFKEGISNRTIGRYGAEAVKLWAGAETYFEEDEYLGTELDYLQTIFYAYRFKPESGATAYDPETIIKLANGVEERADFLPPEQLLHFTYDAELKKGIALIQEEGFEEAANLLDGGGPKKEKVDPAHRHYGGLMANVDGPRSKVEPYLEMLAWDVHTLRAELYNELAIAYSVIEWDKKSDDNYTGYYTKKTYAETRLSTSVYDKFLRPELLLLDLGLDKDGKEVAGFGKGRSSGARHKKRVVGMP